MLHELDAVEGLVRSGRLKVWPDPLRYRNGAIEPGSRIAAGAASRGRPRANRADRYLTTGRELIFHATSLPHCGPVVNQIIIG